jgi:hypothetical protein
MAAGQEMTNCQYRYFAGSRQLSTSVCYDKDHHWGIAKAYNRKGEVIYERQLRRIAGHSTVSFSWYSNGGVKTAAWSSAPDGGIQWYKSFTTFTEDGQVNGEIEDSYDDRVTVKAPREIPATPTVVVPTKPAVAECAVIYSSEFWFTNFTPFAVQAIATHRYRPTERYIIHLMPGETKKCGQVILAQQFDEPGRTFDFVAVPLRSTKKQRLVVITADNRPAENPAKEVRRYYYEVRRVQ